VAGERVAKKDLLNALADTMDAGAVMERYPGLTVERLREVLREAAGPLGPDDTVELHPHHRRHAAPAGGMVIIHTDGASRGNPGLAGLGALLEDEDGQVLGAVSKFLGETTNNQAEYMAVIEGLKAAIEMGAKSVELRADSELVVKQINGQYKVKKPELKPRHAEVMGLLEKFGSYVVKYIPREKNAAADALANEAIDKRQT